MKKTIAFLTFAVALVSAALAVEPVAAAKTYSAEDIVRAGKMFQAMKFDEQMDLMVDNMLKLQMRNNPHRDVLEPVMRDFFHKHISYAALKDDLARMYLDIFTPAEIDEITRFYLSPAGKKLAGGSGELRQRAAELGQRKVQANQLELQQAVAAALLKKQQEQNAAAPAPAK